MISWNELVKSYHAPNPDQILHLEQLHFKLNSLRAHYSFPLLINSGFRSMEDHEDIYERLNSRQLSLGQKPLAVPLGSLHLQGAAADIDDPKKELQKWILNHLELIEILDLYFEDFDATPHWVHAQLYAPKSGHRFFQP